MHLCNAKQQMIPQMLQKENEDIKYSQMEITRRKKSMKIKKPQMLQLAKWVNEQDSILDAAEALGIDRSTLSRILQNSKASSDTIAKIFPIVTA